MPMSRNEFWVFFKLLIILAILAGAVAGVFYVLKKRREPREKTNRIVTDSAKHLVSLMEPLLSEAETAARMFEAQILEKKQLIKDLNEKLDSRIISLNLLLNRAEACLTRSGNFDEAGGGIYELQDSIITLFNKGVDPDQIAGTLGISRKEVDLVISLKKKFMAMENGS